VDLLDRTSSQPIAANEFDPSSPLSHCQSGLAHQVHPLLSKAVHMVNVFVYAHCRFPRHSSPGWPPTSCRRLGPGATQLSVAVAEAVPLQTSPPLERKAAGGGGDTALQRRRHGLGS